MAYKIITNFVVPQQVTETLTELKVPIGSIITAKDEAYGVSQFIFLAGVAATQVGDLVVFRGDTGATVRAVAASRGPCAVAMSANVAGQYGWYQIQGLAIVRAGTVAADGAVYATATAGQVDDAVTAGSLVDGARFKSADGSPSAGLALVQIAFPSLGGLG